MHGDRTALSFVYDIDADAEKIAELPLESVQVRVDRLCSVASAGASDVLARAGSLASRARFRLPHGQTFFDDFFGQRFGIRGSRNGPRMPHTDIAFQ